LADEFDSCLTLQLAPPSGESGFRMNNYMFIGLLLNFFVDNNVHCETNSRRF
jgi:hypothetical protein